MLEISSVRPAEIKIQAMFRGQQSRNQQLLEAAESGDIERTKHLIKHGADVDAKDRYGMTALHWAADNGSVDIVKLLLKAGANVNVTNIYGKTALHYAVIWGFTDIVKALVIAGADVNATDNDGETALQFAKNGGHHVKVKNTIEAGKNELIKLHQDKLNKYQKKQDQLPGYIKFVLKQSLQGTSAVTRTIVQFIEKPLSKSQKEQAKKYIEERASAEAATTLQTMARGNQGRK